MNIGEATMIRGDWLEVSKGLPTGHFHCCVTSPPYFALRSYLDKDHQDKGKEIGSEPTPEDFIETMVECFRGVRRVLHPSGTLFVNLGDSYCAAQGGRQAAAGLLPVDAGRIVDNPGWNAQQGVTAKTIPGRDCGSKPGELFNMPHRVAEALRQDGWIWRQTIVWAKKSPMPESCKGWRWEKCRVKVKDTTPSDWREKGASRRGGVNEDGRFGGNTGIQAKQAKYIPCPGCYKCSHNDGWVLRRGKGRCTTAHEYLFVFTKSPLYFWDSAAFVEEAKDWGTRDRTNWQGKVSTPGNPQRGCTDANHAATGRNPRSVWTISTEPSSEKHFAAYPSELVRRCLQAGTSDGGCCPECGAPWAPMVESKREATRPAHESKTYIDPEGSPYEMHSGSVIGNRDPERHCTTTNVIGYRPTCACEVKGKTLALEEARQREDLKFMPWSVPCRVLDPFAGTGTTLQTAKWMGRDATGVELHPGYIQIAQHRLLELPVWMKRGQKKFGVIKKIKPLPGQKGLFDEEVSPSETK